MNETQPIDCMWVPGTNDRVRLKLAGHMLEYRLSVIAKIFGARLLDDLYLRGRTTLLSSPQQRALLA
ncbi:hypothetical protein [Deinococcus alpinitundrae]|uniref:hypothetical protein n=1 Tax=Deinococcus alpinitundrae TaxID=468913 RepID=UPI00137AC534|nr:hypothetical protein [Deinococcus alpinitundrae]